MESTTDGLHHLAVLFPGPIRIISRAMSLYGAQELRATLEQRLRTAGRQPILTIPMGDRPDWPINVTQAITWTIVPEGGTTPW